MLFFFVKQKTAYEMRISDWSSDLCSSDLQRLAAFLLVELARLLDAQGPLDEGQPAAQLVLGQMPGQRHDFAARRPRAEQARNAEEAFLLGLAPQLAQDRQPRVAAVANDVVRLARPARDRGGRVRSEEHTSELQSITRSSY